MKVTLVYPRLNRVDCGSGSIHMPLGILYLASYLREHGHQISVIDATFMDSWETFEENLKKESPDIIGISFSSPLAEYGFKAAGIAKKCFPDRLVITGGPHSLVDMSGTICKDFIDMVVIGEGEKTLLEIVEACSQDKGFHHIKGICFKDGKKLVKTEDKTDFIENLDDLPMPALDLLDIEKYIQETGRVTFITSRGCPGKCYYCQPTIDKMFGRKIRGHSPERIIEEIKIVAERYYDKNKNFLFEFVDDTFCYSKKRTLEFCELIKKHALTNLPYWVISRIDHCKNKDVVVALKNAGCLGISFGVESGSQRILNEMGKNTSVQTIREVFHN